MKARKKQLDHGTERGFRWCLGSCKIWRAQELGALTGDDPLVEDVIKEGTKMPSQAAALEVPPLRHCILHVAQSNSLKPAASPSRCADRALRDTTDPELVATTWLWDSLQRSPNKP